MENGSSKWFSLLLLKILASLRGVRRAFCNKRLWKRTSFQSRPHFKEHGLTASFKVLRWQITSLEICQLPWQVLYHQCLEKVYREVEVRFQNIASLTDNCHHISSYSIPDWSRFKQMFDRAEFFPCRPNRIPGMLGSPVGQQMDFYTFFGLFSSLHQSISTVFENF